MRNTIFTLCIAACADDLAPGSTPDAGSNPIPELFVHDEAGGVVTTHVDATSESEWRHLDLATRTEAGTSWDLGFRRFAIDLNEAAGVELAALPDADFAAVTQPPATGWLTDTAEMLAFDAGDGWYAYNPETHVLTPRSIVYVVKTAGDEYFKLAMAGYYDDAGTSGHPSFRWAPVVQP
jgi:hypothetical protein